MQLLDTRKRCAPRLTPMIDVVFLLLVFFMLAARFGADQSVPILLGGGEGEYSGPPRLIELAPDGLLLNGIAYSIADILVELNRLSETSEDVVILRGQEDAQTQMVVEILLELTQAGYTNVVLVE